MTANYLISDFQKGLLASIEARDREAVDFFVVAPLVIDCRDDAAEYRTAVTDSQRDTILKRFEAGKLQHVSQLLRPAYAYARRKIEERFRLLDRDAVARVRAFIDDWRCEKEKKPHQRSRPAEHSFATGIDVILPGGMRLAYDLASLTGL